jgi:putative transposase
VEFNEHLGYSKHEKSGSGNNRIGYTSKTLRTEDGQIELNTPRDRHSNFEPQLALTGQTRFASMDDKILSLYAKGVTTREIVVQFKGMVSVDVSATQTSDVTGVGYQYGWI